MALSRSGRQLRVVRSSEAAPLNADGNLDFPLDIATQTLATIEREIQAMQSLTQQITARLAGQLATLSECRQILAEQQLSVSSPVPNLTPISAQDAQLRLYCLGQFQAYWNDQAIPLRSAAKSTMIVKVLAAAQRRLVQREVLLETLWPGADPALANNRLKVAIYHLRQAFALAAYAPDWPGCILFQNGCYALNPSMPTWTDVEAFEAHWHDGMRLEKAERLAEAITSYMEAERLYRGDFLEEDQFEEWTLLRREQLKDTYLTLLEHLSRCWLKTGHADQAIEGWKKILIKDPWREDAYRHLMVALACAGNRGLALHWYDLCLLVLKDQLGIDPEPETAILSQRIRAGEDLTGYCP